MLSDVALQEFKELYRKRFGVELTNQETSFRANNLVNLYAAVYGEPPVGLLKRLERNEDKTDN